MRNLRFLALLAPALLLPVACEDASSSSGGTFSPEAGPGFDAGPLPEAAPPPDADVVMPPPGVTVTVLDGLTPKKDARVVTHDATGAVIADLKTDATGKVTIATAPSMVTVLTQYGTGPGARFEPLTFAGVADGDNLVVDASDPYGSSTTQAGSFTVTIGAGFAGATGHVVRVGDCSGDTSTPSAPFVLAVSSACVGNQNAVLVAARLPTADADAAYGFAKNVAKPAVNGTVAVGPILSFVAPGETRIDATNRPLDASTYANLYAVANGMAFYVDQAGGGIGEGGLKFTTATGFADAYQSRVTARRYLNQNGGESTERTFLRREATTAPADTLLPVFDFATALPEISTVTLANPTVARPDITLTSAASLATADGAVATLRWFMSAQEQSGRWRFILPPSTTAFKVPALPADAPTQFLPDATASVDEVAFIEASQLLDYKELKALPVSAGGLSLLDGSRALPAAGTVRSSHWTPGD